MCASFLATTPHFECICPDGTRKPLCLSMLFGGPACCCDPSAASGAKATTSKKNCCCQVGSQTSEKVVQAAWHVTGQGLVISQRCCEKELSESVTCVEDQDPAFALTAPLDLLFSIPFDVGAGNSTVAHAGLDYAPQIEPPDLLIRLQRFVI
ncbi:MAG: hypothetical protein K2X38_06495 [Gemmataceae bacterium]|nr:hypothetical protein [Gemmataceae bacterium]